jgi:hypothetical protein
MYTCNCGKEFEKQSSLNSHARFCEKYEKKTKSTTYKIDENLYKCECGKEFSKSQSLNSHFSHCLIHRNGIPISRTYNGMNWDNKTNDEIELIRKKAGSTLKERIENKILTPSFKGKTHSIDTKNKLRNARLNFLENNPNNNIKWYSVSNGKKDIKVQGEWELKVANWLNKNNIQWNRKRLYFSTHSYTPDFYINETTLIEVKGWMKDRDLFKMMNFLKINQQYSILLIEKEEIENLDNLNLFDLKELRVKYDLDDINITTFKSYSDLK